MKDKKFVKEEMKFSYTELTAIEEYLALKEENGLQLKKFENGKFIFEQAPQRKIKYSAVIFTGTSVKDDFVTACESLGWEYVDTYSDELYIFRTQNPNAAQIMTDEKENFKTVAKRAFLQPGYITFSFFALFLFFRVIFLRMSFEGIIATDAKDCAILLIILFSFLQTAAKLLSFGSWYIKSKRHLEENLTVPFLNLKKAEKCAKIWNIINTVFPLVLLGVVVFLGAGYTNITVECWICVALFVINLFAVINGEAKKTKSNKKYLSFAVITLAAAVCTFAVTQWGESEYNKNLNKRLDYNGLPISVSDFAESKENCTDKTVNLKATRLGQHYWFSSVFETEGQNEDYSVQYEIFKSDYPWVTEDYIDLLCEEYEDFDSKLKKADDTYGWEELYFEVHNGKELKTGYARKGNTVIMVERSELSDNSDLYKTAYEKLFEQNW